jgi:uncharacterized protein YjhX (UPF0386 family)
LMKQRILCESAQGSSGNARTIAGGMRSEVRCDPDRGAGRLQSAVAVAGRLKRKSPRIWS